MDAQHGVFAVLERIASFLTPVLQLVIVAVLWRRRSFKLFYYFWLYLIADVLRTTLLWALGGSTFADAYKDAWICSEPAMLIFHVALVLEVIRLLYKAYPGIHSFGKIAISLAVLVAVLLTIFSSPLDIRRATINPSDRTLLELFQAERVLDLGLFLIVLVIVGLFPSAPYGRTVRRHGFLLSALFISASAGFFAINYGLDSDISGLVTVAVQLVLYPLWIWLFLIPQPERLPLPPAQEIERVRQLNEDLLFLARWLKD